MFELLLFILGFLTASLFFRLARRPLDANAIQLTKQTLHDLLRRGRIDSATFQKIEEALSPPHVVPVKAPERPAQTPPGAVQPIVAQLVDDMERADSKPATRPTVVEAVTEESELPATVAEELASAGPARSIHDRAADYARNRAAATAAAIQHEPPPEPHQPWSVWFAAFMEEKNIRWGELVGGLLIVSCSVALVISFWSAIAQRPLLKFGVLNGVTAALFGVGLHAARRWKLPTTSQGILMISTLLVPLNFLAIAAFTDTANSTTLTAVLGESISTLIFATLVLLAAGVIAPHWPIPLTLGVIIPAVTQLFIRRYVNASSSPAMLYGFSTLCLTTYVGSNVFATRRLRHKAKVPERRANELLKLLGLISFPLLSAAGLLIVKSERVQQTLEWLSPLAVLSALPLLMTGMILWKRPGTSAAGLQFVGSCLVVASVIVLAAGFVAGWPQPAPMIGLAFVGFVALTFLAIDLRMPDGHVAAAVFLVLSALLLTHVATGELNWIVLSARDTISVCLSAATGRLLTILAFCGLLAVAGLNRVGQSEAARRYALVSGMCAALSILMLFVFGFGKPGDPERVTWILGLYALIALAGGAWLQKPSVVAIGGILLLGAFFQGFRYGGFWLASDYPGLLTLLSHASFMTVVAAASSRLKATDDKPSSRYAASAWSFTTSCSAALILGWWLVASLDGQQARIPAGFVFWLAFVWLALAWIEIAPQLFGAFQAVFALAWMVLLDGMLREESWYGTVSRGWLHPISLQFQAILLCLYGSFWVTLRIVLRTVSAVGEEPDWRERLGQWLSVPTVTIDRFCIAMSLTILMFLAIYGVVPGIAQELTPVVGETRVVPQAESYQLANVPLESAHGRLIWVLVGVLAVTQIAALLDRPRHWNLAALALVTSTVPLLIASHWQASVAVASATRWSCAVYFFIGSVLLWLRRPIVHRVRMTNWFQQHDLPRLEWYSFGLLVFLATVPLLAMSIFVAISAVMIQPPNDIQVSWLTGLGSVCLLSLIAVFFTTRMQDDSRGWKSLAGSVAVLATMPVFAMTLFVVGQSLGEHPIVGPDRDSFFVEIGLAASYAVPLLIMSLAMIGHAISFRAGSIGFAAGLLLSFSATAAYLLSSGASGLLSIEEWVRLAQLNSILASVYALGWMALVYRFAGETVDDQPWLKAQVGVGIGFILVPLALLTLHLALRPDANLVLHCVAGWWGWPALILALLALSLFSRLTRRGIQEGLLGCAIFSTLTMVALQSDVTDSSVGSWLAFHMLQVMLILVGALSFVVDQLRSRRAAGAMTQAAFRWAPLIVGMLAYLGLRGVVGDPQTPWWSMVAWLSAAGISMARAWQTQRHRYAFFAAALFNLSASLWWIEVGHKLSRATDISLFIDFLLLNVIVAALPVVIWMFVYWRSADTQRGAPSVQTAAIAFSLLWYSACVAVGLAADASGWRPLNVGPWTTGAALASLLIANAACLWHPRNALAIFGCYVTGLAGMATMLDSFDLGLHPMVWNSSLLLAAYAFLTSYFWSRRSGIAQVADQLKIPRAADVASRTQGWLIPFNGILATVVCVLAIWTQFTCDSASLRLAASQGIAAVAFAMGMLARGRRETELRYSALVIGVVAAVAFGWSWMDPAGESSTVLNRAVILASALMGMAAFYGIGLAKVIRRENDWTTAGKELVPVLVGLGTLSVCGILAGEVGLYIFRGATGMSLPAIVAIAAALAVAIIASFVAAVVPGRDPLGLAPQRRTLYVYAAEVLMALLFLHIRVTMPQLFSGFFQQYWTLIVMGIAFGGVGLSEWFRRRDQAILAGPLESTGALLPLLPVIGFWVTDQRVDYSAIMLIAGVLYAGLSLMRKSFGFGVLAALSANGGLWYFLQTTAQIQFLMHPQLWLIPGAVCVLVAAYLNRTRLNASQMATIRYLSSAVIYASSTADVFINGVGQAPWLPAILAALSIVGIFAGILLRVRAFLFLGLAFLVIALMTVVWHAAVDLQQTWLWYVTGIVAGVIIITVFAIFERKRNEVLEVVDQLKSWDA